MMMENFPRDINRESMAAPLEKELDLMAVETLARTAHEGQFRLDGRPYITHPLAVRELVASHGFGTDYQAVALLHDVLEDTRVTYEQLVQLTNTQIAEGVAAMTKKPGYKIEEYVARVHANALAHIVKLADRLHNLLDCQTTPWEFQKKQALETRTWYLRESQGTVFAREISEALVALEKNWQNKAKIAQSA
jgi:(p)ppGpp synthase/HD superfamily hydrolase